MNMELMEVGEARVTASGMEIHGELSFEQWAEVGKRIGRASTAFQLAIGDWLVYGQEHFEGAPALPGLERKAGRVSSDLMDYACTLTGFDRAELSDFAWVARHVPSSARAEQLTYRHFRILSKLSPAEQQEWVELVIGHDERVPTRQLAHSIALYEKTGEKRIWGKEEIVDALTAENPPFIDAPEAALERFIRSMQRQNFAEWTPEMKAFLWRRWADAERLMEALGK
jgi:hypothetical protein